MAGKVEIRRQKLRDDLVDIAEREIAEKGARAIKVRELARLAGCAVGAIYNVFDDLQGIIIAVNGRTFHNLGEVVAGSIQGMETAKPTERLIAMSNGYLQFATDHPRLWRCLFDLRLRTDMEVPEWYLRELSRLFGYISAPLMQIYPQKSASEIELLTRTLFSSVHGIVLLGLENRISGVPRDQLKQMISLLLVSATK